MATPQLSPGVLVREVDLTVGRADNVLDNIGAICGPFERGPVNEPVDITTEQELLQVFGKPQSIDAQYEYWMTASAFLSYGGVLKVVRTADDQFKNASAIRSGGVSIGSTGDLKILNFDDYEQNWADDIADYIFAAKSPGSWANNLKIAVIDDKADQILNVGAAVTSALAVGYGVTTTLTNIPAAGIGTTSFFNGYLKGIVTGIGQSVVDVKITSVVDNVGSEFKINYQQRNQLRSFRPGNTINFYNSSVVGMATVTLGGPEANAKDWYDEQVIDLDNTSIFWRSIAPKPITTQYVLDRNGQNDAMHIAIIDDTGDVTGIRGNLLEKHLFVSKASDAISAENAPQRTWWKDYLARYSDYVFVGDNPSDNLYPGERVYATDFISGFSPIGVQAGAWNLRAQDKVFSAIGNVVYSLTGGLNYNGVAGINTTAALQADLGSLFTSYNLFQNVDEVEVDYLIMGPGMGNKFGSQAKANHLISIANSRKDCIAVISPHRLDVVGLTNRDTQTDNIIEFFAPLQSSSYAIFDAGYKYTYDRFNNKFRYIPCNGDVAGLCVRTSIFAYPWFSPAGQQRGIINNAIKLAYNPSKPQRDQLYPLRINPIINKPGLGVLLFGDKTALGYASAFDRINVRRLFLTVEQALARTAEAQLFELNDEITRANFVNIVEPYLRDVQAKRGLYGFLVVCDESNNTPDVIDNNEFRADIFLKPAKSINYVTLTFVATRTGVAFEEVVGTV
jgi:hypothetical protein